MIEFAMLLLGFGSTEFNVAVRDAATGKPVDGAFVVAREFTTVGQFHGSKTYCIRGDVAQVSGPRVAMRLPDAGTDTLRGARAIEAFAYRPGYCVARTADGRATSYSLHGPGYGGERPKGLDPSAETKLDLRRSSQGAEDRLLYLGEMVQGLACEEPRWSDRGREGLERVANAMIAEAESLARTRYEKSLVERMKGGLVAAREMKGGSDSMPAPWALQMLQAGGLSAGFPRDFIVGDPALRVSWDASRKMVVAAMPGRIESAQVLAAPSVALPGNAAVARAGNAAVPQPGYAAVARPGNAAVAATGGAVLPQAVVAQPGVRVEAARLQPVIHCRHGAPSACDLNERDAQGVTALQSFVGALKPAEVKVLLAAGADPSIASKPSGVAPIETLVERLSRTQPDTATAKDALEILDMLAAHPKVTLPRKLREDLAADPSTWTSVQHSVGLNLLTEARPRLLAVAARAEEAPACAPLGYMRDFGRQPPIRLRYP